MKLPQIIAVIVAIATIALLYNLPKVVINETDQNKLGTSESTNGIANEKVSPAPKISANTYNTIQRLRNSFLNASDTKKRCNFADSLANQFIAIQKYDSADSYAKRLVLLNSDNNSRKIAGNIYYRLYTLADEPTAATRFATKAQEQFSIVLDTDPDNAEVKNNLAMTYVTSENPMKAIAVLREVIAKNPSDENAIFNLGFLSIQSGQHAKAVERFEKLIKMNERNWKAHLYLGISQQALGKQENAVKEFELVAKNTKDLDLKAQAEQLIEEKN